MGHVDIITGGGGGRAGDSTGRLGYTDRMDRITRFDEQDETRVICLIRQLIGALSCHFCCQLIADDEDAKAIVNALLTAAKEFLSLYQLDCHKICQPAVKITHINIYIFYK